jgi:NAD(P)-dependent dehydrogenase (short-subunit alcohol dehydrogenase family)
MKVALVTGGNKGIGLEVARQLAGEGVRVLLASRDLNRGERAVEQLGARAVLATPIALDVTDPDSVRCAAAQVRRDIGRLDVLVNNAGTFTGALAVDTTADLVRNMFEVNVFGVVAVTHAMLPLLCRSPAPRIVNVSSTTASLTLTSAGADLPGDAIQRMGYTSSKAALNMLTVQYAQAFAQDPRLSRIKINSATPGYTATDINGHRGTRSVRDAARVIVELATLADDGPTGGFFADDGPVPW